LIASERLARLLPSPADYIGLRTSWRGDVLAGVTVGVVALPLALGFGITSGLGAEAGVITAIVAGLVAGLLGGSNVQISGPTGAMTAVLIPVVARHGPDAVVAVGLLAGLFVMLMAVAGLGRYLAYVPWPVVEGFTVGIAAIIFLQQVPAAIGAIAPVGDNAAIVALRALTEPIVPSRFASAVVVLAVVAILMVVLPRIHRAFPSSLIAIAIATVGAELAGLDLVRIGTLPSTIPTPSMPALSFEGASTLFPAALAIAVLAALESLLSAKVADGMGRAGRHDPDRELLGQGLANIASILCGGMPATGAIARTAVNVRSGARTRVAAIAHALVLLAIVLFAAALVARVPVAALAGVLMVTAVRMVERHNVRAVVLATRSDALVLVTTATATIVFDLIVAVEIGLAVAAFLALRAVAQTASVTAERIAATSDETEDLLGEGIVSYRLDGALFFGAAQRFLTELTAVSDVRVVILRLPELQVLDATGASALGEIVSELEERGITVLLKGPRPEHLRTLRAVGVIDRLAHEKHVLPDLESAVAHARAHLSRAPAHS
jgi:SulP family sulfate permease